MTKQHLRFYESLQEHLRDLRNKTGATQSDLLIAMAYCLQKQGK